MRKLVIIAALTLTAVACAGCGNVDTSDSSNVNQALANTDVAQNESENIAEEDSEEVSDSFVVDKEMFQQLPEDGISAFEFMSKEVKLAFPDVHGTMSYGYAGTVSINKCDCYKFVVFEDSDDSYAETATVAVDQQGTKLYLYDMQADEYSEFVEDPSSQTEQLSWCEITTESFVEYLSAETTEEVVVASNSEVVSDSSVAE